MDLLFFVIFCVGCWTTFWTVLGVVTPSRSQRMRHSFLEKFGHLADRLGIQIKNDNDT